MKGCYSEQLNDLPGSIIDKLKIAAGQAIFIPTGWIYAAIYVADCAALAC